MNDQKRFEQLVQARHPCVWFVTYEEEHALSVVRHAAVENGWECMVWSVTGGLRDGLLEGSTSLADTDHPAGALFHLCQGRVRQGIFVMLDLAGHLKDERTLRTLREAIAKLQSSGCTLVLIDQHDDVPPVVRAMATRVEISFPDEQELQELVKRTLREVNQERRIQVDLTRRDLDVVVRNLRGLTRRQARQVIIDCVTHDRRFDSSDINQILAHKRQALGSIGLLDYIESPTDLGQIGGLKRLKGWLKNRQNALSDEAGQFGIPAPRGVLMLGVQGAGKSLAAKAVATAWRRPLLRLDVGALYDKYIGESERRLRDALRQAEMMSPIILWIDEIEKAFASAASQSSDGGLSKRMFGTLLTWMQEHEAPVFLIATANDIEALPPELLRKGRFDEIFFVDLPDLEARHAIFSIHLKKRKRDPKKFDLDNLAQASEGFSGAEIEQAVVSGLHDAFAAGQELTTGHVLAALQNSPPLSVTMAERVAELRRWSRGRCVPAD
jgi:ATP-dependent 26S proteasome regulatory subunit